MAQIRYLISEYIGPAILVAVALAGLTVAIGTAASVPATAKPVPLVRWEVRDVATEAALERLLLEGWEPFATYYEPTYYYIERSASYGGEWWPIRGVTHHVLRRKKGS